MSRKFLDTIKTEMETVINDNQTGDVEPADVRGVLGDMIDSLKQDEGTLYSNVDPAATGYAVGANWAVIDEGYAVAEGDDGEFLNLSLPDGTVTTTPTPGYSYTVKAAITLEASNSIPIDLAIGVNGAPSSFVTTVVGDGSGDPVSRYWEAFIKTAGASDAIGILMRHGSGGTTSIDINSIALVAVIEPTNNP